MSSKINVLPDFVIDQIAAGEVLENPASAVKELVENSLDAGAKKIQIEIEGGGLQKIIIEDDGCGMSSADAAMCLKRHATSKISSTEELNTLSSMGFRGEALAALASVTKLDLRTSDGSESTKIVASGGQIISMEPCARNRGTSIEVRNLFFNAPARLKFQKSPASCAAAILKTIETLSLSHPDVHFTLLSNGKLTFEAKPKEWNARIEEVYGPLAYSLSFSEPGFSLLGRLSRPEEGRTTRSLQTLFVNRRPIVSPMIARAVKEGFGTRMSESLFPSFVLFLDISPDLVDVNVHPQKKEVRFREEGKVFASVRKAVSTLFEKEAPEIRPMPWEFTRPNSIPEFTHFGFSETFSSQPLPLKIPGRALTLLGNYLLYEENGWILVDLPGAEARILFEAMSCEKPVIQTLIWPLEMHTESPEEMVTLLQPLGIEARILGRQILAIDAIPSEMKESLVLEFIRHYSSKRTLAASITKISRSRTKTYSLEEGDMIWKKLQNCKDMIYDPLGRKITSPISEEEIKKRFEKT